MKKTFHFSNGFIPEIEAIVVEINLRKRKWLLIGSYNPHKNMIGNHLDSIGKLLNDLCGKYENLILFGDFNAEICEDEMQLFCTTYNFKSLVNKPTCFKNPNNPSCIDLILTNKSLSFQNTSMIETGLSDFHSLTITTMKCNFQKQVQKVITYRNYKYFDNDRFRNDLLDEMITKGIRNIECHDFEILFLNILNRHAPLKKRYIRANNAPFMNKTLCKAIMVRSRLRNKFLKLNTEESKVEYTKQSNYCV